MSDQDKLVLIVHAIDTEGPLYESPAASFERLEELFGIHREATLTSRKVSYILTGLCRKPVGRVSRRILRMPHLIEVTLRTRAGDAAGNARAGRLRQNASR